MPEFRRPAHVRIAALLRRMDAEFLLRAQCFFGGGTQIVMAHGEYRESRDVDFMCSNRAGYRLLRETVAQDSLGAVFREPVKLAREVRADRDGIRTFLDDGGEPIKFEIVLEGRIDVAGAKDRRLRVPALDAGSAVVRDLKRALAMFGANRGYQRECIVDLLIDDEKGLRLGIAALRAFLGSTSARGRASR